MENSTQNLLRVEVLDRFPVEQVLLNQTLKKYGIEATVIKIPFYKFHFTEKKTNISELLPFFTDSVLQKVEVTPYNLDQNIAGAISVSFLPGVTDNSAKALEEAILLSGHKATCYSGNLFVVLGEDHLGEKAFDLLKNEVGNSLIQEISFIERGLFLEGDRFKNIKVPEVHITHHETADEVSLDLSDKELIELSRTRCLALNLEEMQAIKNFYKKENIIEERANLKLPLWPTDVELEVLAQTWSEHCKHKIFAAEIDYTDEKTGESVKVDSLYKSFIKRATKEIEEEGVDWLISVFSDNAGIVRFDNKIDLCIKVETHNSPSALDPYGGAITGILGVNRDILGCGLGAKPIANTDVFCFASTELPKKINPNQLPAGLMEPAKLLKGVHKGVEDGGNKSGIPTVNGAIVFDIDYAGKPLVFCGTIGTLPQTLPDGREGKSKGAKAGDKIFVLGGAVGADGIHGATFSSMELNEDSPATAVQIGDPLTQKRVMDFLLRARDLGLYTCVTDNGAGGISSSIGEMAELTGGAKIDLNLHPRKYPGLSPWEIMISESQERMTVAVNEKNCEVFEKLAESSGVEATCLGEFTDSGALDIYYKDKRVAYLNMDFLHDGVPKLKLKAKGNTSFAGNTWVDFPKEKLPSKKSEILTLLLNKENVASKDHWVRQYDHEVQGATISKPFPGKQGISPGDSGCLDLEIHGGEADSMATVGCGLAPRWSQENAELMAKLSVDEAVRNIMASGTNPDKICLLDNFCWPDPVETEKNPEGSYKLGQLVDTCRGLFDICKLYKTPLVSGKDSMKNDFRGKNRGGDDLVISIKPTLLVTAMGHGKKSQLVRSPVRKAGVHLYRFGAFQSTLLWSECHETFGDEVLATEGNPKSYEKWDFSKCYKHYQGLYKIIQKGIVHNLHDLSDGGLAVALAEVLFDGGFGFEGDVPETMTELFGEGPGQFVLGVEENKRDEFDDLINQMELEASYLGRSTDSGDCNFFKDDKTKTSHLLKSWQRDWTKV